MAMSIELLGEHASFHLIHTPLLGRHSLSLLGSQCFHIDVLSKGDLIC